MGTGYTLICKKCGYKISANLGVGFFFPRAYQQTMEAARAGKLGKTVKQFLEEHPDGAVNAESVFLQCTECGALKKGQDLSMYVRIPDVPRKERGIWAVAAPQADADYVSPMELKNDGTYQFYGYGNICSKCKKPMKPITDKELMKMGEVNEADRLRTEISCPKCKEPLWIEEIMMWD